jgi:hypothetical protein
MKMSQVNYYLCLKHLPIRRVITKEHYEHAMAELPSDDFTKHYRLIDLGSLSKYYVIIDEVENTEELTALIYDKVSSDIEDQKDSIDTIRKIAVFALVLEIIAGILLALGVL